ncbi:MAG: hypothetical protein KF744_01260 [Taibaiella sp.]|nr:hypothetical protein [Taibaiella sp.]
MQRVEKCLADRLSQKTNGHSMRKNINPANRLYKQVLWPAIIICAVALVSTGKEVVVRTNGDVVKAVLTSKSGSYSTKAGGKVCTFEYDGVIFVNRVDRSFLDGSEVGDTVLFYHLPQFQSVFVNVKQPLSSTYGNFLAGLLFLLLLVVALIYVCRGPMGGRGTSSH